LLAQTVENLFTGSRYGARNRRVGLAAGTSTPHRLSTPKLNYLFIAAPAQQAILLS